MNDIKHKRFLGIDITPRSEYIAKIKSQEIAIDILAKQLTARQDEVELLQDTIEEMARKNIELRLINKSLQEKLPKRDTNGKFTKKTN